MELNYKDVGDMLEDLLVGLGVFALIIVVICMFLIEIVAIGLIVGVITSFFGFSGILWWIVAIGLFLIFNMVIGAIINRK